jgi:hypothetical protein
MDCEIVMPMDLRQRQRVMLAAMLDSAAAAGVTVHTSPTYTGSSPIVMTWGLGHPVRRPAMLRHIRDGGHVVAWDLGYWIRDCHFRLSIDRDHPPCLLPDMPALRFDRCSIALRDDYDANGPIILVGFGKKSREALGLRGLEWEEQTYYALRNAYPDKRIVYRPKRPEAFVFCDHSEGSIEDVLRGASLVVCHHSNVAIDACMAGIPVVCKDGAAAGLYNNSIKNPYNPTHAARLAFLRRLAWWQWKPTEAKHAWTFLQQQICA